MDSLSNVLFCGTINTDEKGSWDKTNRYFLHALSDISNTSQLDYSIKNILIRKAHESFIRLYFGETIVRDPVYDFLLEYNFKKQYSKLKTPPELVIHSGSICVPKGYEMKCPHVLYTDATIMGSILYGNCKPSIRALEMFTKETLKYIDRVKSIYTFNEWTKQSLIEDFKVEEDKVVNVGFGANLNPYFGRKDYSNNQILIVLRRGLEENKGLFLLLEAFKIAYKQNSSIKLSVVGTTLEKVDGVTYYEGFPREKTIELFQHASLFAMPALFEPNGMVYIEALACKTPILGLNRLAFPEFSGYGKYGFIVEDNSEKIAQTILKALTDPDKLRTMGEDGQKFVLERFNWDTVAGKILEIGIKKDS